MKSNLRFIKSALEYRHIDELKDVPRNLRGIYALYKKQGKYYNLVYIGMSGKEAKGRIRARLYIHKRNKSKIWTHFSYYEVWDNITDQEISELEGLFRQLYRFGSRANTFNKQQTHRPLIHVRRQTEKDLEIPHVTKKVLGV